MLTLEAHRTNWPAAGRSSIGLTVLGEPLPILSMSTDLGGLTPAIGQVA
jgi:hypothetical protein